MTLPGILHHDHIEEAAELLSDYYTDLFASEMPRTGSRFDSWAGGGDAPGLANRCQRCTLMNSGSWRLSSLH